MLYLLKRFCKKQIDDCSITVDTRPLVQELGVRTLAQASSYVKSIGKVLDSDAVTLFTGFLGSEKDTLLGNGLVGNICKAL